MKNWRTKKALYEIHEISAKAHEVYSMIMTGDEVSEWCRRKNENHGYIKGLGGDRSYNCWAVLAIY